MPPHASLTSIQLRRQGVEASRKHEEIKIKTSEKRSKACRYKSNSDSENHCSHVTLRQPIA